MNPSQDIEGSDLTRYLSPQTATALRILNIRTLEQLARHQPDEREPIGKSGKRGFAHLEELLTSKGLRFGMKDSEIRAVLQAKDPEKIKLLNWKIEDCDIGIRTLSAIKRGLGAKTVSDALQFQKNDLLKLRNCGSKSVAEWDEFLSKHGLYPGMTEEEINIWAIQT